MATPLDQRSPAGPTARLAATGRTLPLVAPSVANYVPAVRIGSFALTSGQLPFVDGNLVAAGKVGAEVSVDEATEMTRICALNALGEIFGDAGVHVRSAVGVAVLPLNAPVEVEIMVEVLPDGMTDDPHRAD